MSLQASTETVLGARRFSVVPSVLLSYWSWPLVGLSVAWILAASLSLSNPLAAAHQHWPLFVLGVLGAVVGNATAVGGGLVFVPATMILYEMDPVESLQLAIAGQAFGMTSGALAWARRGHVPTRALGWALPPLCLGCVVGGVVFPADASTVKGLFGPVSVAIGASVLLFGRTKDVRDVVPGAALVGVGFMAFVGSVVTAWVAIGVGELLAAYLMMRHQVRADRAIALGVVCLSVSSIFLALIQFGRGYIPWDKVAFMGLGCILGARIAPAIVSLIPEDWIKRGFAFIAIADGILFIVRY